MTQPALERAFDAALAKAEKLLRTDMKTVNGVAARQQLEKLVKELKRERSSSIARGLVDREWLQRTLRWLVEWVPDDELTLVAALGGIVRAAPTPLS